MNRAWSRALGATTLLVLATGCSTLQASAVPTGPHRLSPRSGAIAIYASGRPPQAVDVGVVQVSALGEEGTVDVLLPLFVQRVADLGGNAAVIEGVRSSFSIVARPMTEIFYYRCGRGMMCASTRYFTHYDEVMTVVMSGKAALTSEAPRLTPSRGGK